MRRKRSPLHDLWHRRVDGQIRHTMNCHPEWFNFKDESHKEIIINSLAKRIVGEIVIDATTAAEDVVTCPQQKEDASSEPDLLLELTGDVTGCPQEEADLPPK